MRMMRAALALILAGPVMGGCVHWVAALPPAPSAAATPVAPDARIELRDGRTYHLREVAVLEDSLVGVAVDAPHARVALALAEVRTVRTREVRYTEAVVAAAIAILVVLLLGGGTEGTA